MADAKAKDVGEYFESNPEESKVDVSVKPADVEKKHSEDIIDTEFKPSLMFEKFAGKVYDAKKSDVKDPSKIASRRGEYTNYRAQQKAFETPLERYTRLKSEIADFQKDMDTISKQAGASGDAAVGDVSKKVASDLGTLEKELGAVMADKRLAPFLEHSFPVSQADIAQKGALEKLLAELQKAGGAKAPVKPEEGVTYELYYNHSESNKLDLAQLDRRLAGLEASVGSGKELGPGIPDIQTGIMHLQRKLDLLDQPKLDAVYRRVKSLMAELELFEQQKAAVQGGKPTGAEQKIEELYALVQRWDKSSEQLPLVVARLQSLKDLHEESANAVARVNALEKQQAAIDSLLQNGRTALDSVTKSFAENVKTMQANVQSLEKRFEEVNKKLATLK